MRRYEDPVEVRRGPVGGMLATLAPGTDDPTVDHTDDYADERAPAQFLWRGRLWKVRAVLAHWVETGPWWSSPGVRAVIGSHDEEPPGDQPGDQLGDQLGDQQGEAVPRPLGDLITERELWRVEAGRGRDVDDAGGVFDLAFDWADGRWQLVGCVD
jgi:hypothetical protein